MNINWKVRFKNPQFIVQIIIAVLIPIMTYAGITAQDITSWAVFMDLIIGAISNPYVISMVVVSVYNAVVDPTTTGIADSIQALSYEQPKGGNK